MNWGSQWKRPSRVCSGLVGNCAKNWKPLPLNSHEQHTWMGAVRLGDDRTAMMIASYRMAEEGWSAEKAKREWRSLAFRLLIEI